MKQWHVFVSLYSQSNSFGITHIIFSETHFSLGHPIEWYLLCTASFCSDLKEVQSYLKV